MNPVHLAGTTQGPTTVLTGATPLPLEDTQAGWLVVSGQMALFAAERVDGRLDGARRYLGEAGPGAALFGLALPGGHGLLGVPVGVCEVVPLAPTEAARRLAGGDAQALGWLASWISALDLAAEDDSASLGAALVSGEGRLTLKAGDRLAAPPGTIAWIHQATGRLRWRGHDDVQLEPSQALLPLGRGMIIEAEEEAQVVLAPASALGDPAAFEAALAGTGRVLAALIAARVVREHGNTAARHEARRAQEARVTASALGELIGLIEKSVVVRKASGNHLLDATRAIGDFLGVEIKPPAASEDLARVRDPIEAICRASLMRFRRVLLEPPWWRHDVGPLLAYRQEGHAPVALLPKNGGYDLYDPIDGTRTPVTEAVAHSLEPFAVMFYRSLPGRALQAVDIVRFALHGKFPDLAWVVALGVLGSLLGMITPQMTGMLVDRAIPDADRGLLLQMAFALFMGALGGLIFNICRGMLAQRIEGMADSETQSAVWDRVLNLGAPFFRQFTVGDLSNRVMAISSIRKQLSGATLTTVLSSVFALLNLGLMASYSAQLTMVAVVLTIVTVSVATGLSWAKLRLSRPLRQLEGELHGLVIQLINGVVKLQVSASEGRAFAHWAARYKDRMARTRDIDILETALKLFNEIMPILSSMAIFWFGVNYAGLLDPAHGVATGTFLAFMAAFGTFQGGVTGLAGTIINLLDVSVLWGLAKPVIDEAAEVREGMADPGRLSGRVALDRVTFRYQAGGRTILDEISLEARPGEHIAFVGPSGCGKSTILRLVLGFEKPESGLVTFDGQDLATLDVRAVRRQLGVVLQTGKVTAGSIFDNISAGAVISREEAWDAARDAGFEEDIKAMPMGMHTVVAEAGMNLSGGQRQRLLIARALALKPRIILFDEATSALDNTTQAIVSQSLNRMKVTRLSIAHRLSTIRDADRIYVFDGGKVVQVGTYDELAAVPGLFQNFVSRQAL